MTLENKYEAQGIIGELRSVRNDVARGLLPFGERAADLLCRTEASLGFLVNRSLFLERIRTNAHAVVFAKSALERESAINRLRELFEAEPR